VIALIVDLLSALIGGCLQGDVSSFQDGHTGFPAVYQPEAAFLIPYFFYDDFEDLTGRAIPVEKPEKIYRLALLAGLPEWFSGR
jgi:hypothetical protein